MTGLATLLLLSSGCGRTSEVGCDTPWDEAAVPWARAVCDLSARCAADPASVADDHDQWCVEARSASPVPDGWTFDACAASHCIARAEELADACEAGTLTSSEARADFYVECGDLTAPLQ